MAERKVLLKFTHGIGDAAQFTVVLKHLRRYRPEWVVDVLAGRGKHSAFRGLCHATYFDGQPRPDESAYDEVKWVGWYENYNGYRDRPNSKITNCLAEEFHIPYDPALGRYEVRYTRDEWERAHDWLARVGCTKWANGQFQAVGLHYEGNTSTAKKNVGHHHARAVCEAVAGVGGKVILFDWDRRSPLPDAVNVINPGVGPGDIWGNFGSGDAAMIAAVVDQLAGFVGIDSGPGKIATATHTPTVIVWTGHNPLQFHDPAPNTVHLVPGDYEGSAPISGDPARLEYFRSAYRFMTYGKGGLGFALCRKAVHFITGVDMAEEATPSGLVRHGPFWVRAGNFDQDLVIVQDVFFGDCYRTSLYDLGEWKNVVDVGAHIGTFTHLVNARNPAARIAAVEACPENIDALRANVQNIAFVIQGACTYEPGELALLNSVRSGCESTGGSVMVRKADLSDPNHPLRQHGYQYWDDLRPLRKVSLGEIMAEAGMKWVDCLKLDCEGAELSILETAPEIERHVRFVFGEYHDHARWEELRARKFSDWAYGKLHEADGRGLFHLVNPRFNPAAPLPALTPEPPAEEPAQSSEPLTFERPADVDYDMHEPLARLVRATFGKDGKPRIVEIGVKRGHSALAYFDACPAANVVGYDNYVAEPTAESDYTMMRGYLAAHIDHGSFTHVKADSRDVAEFPKCDLFFVDGDHSFAGAFNDITKAALASELVVIDDYHPEDTWQPVTAAVHWFLICSPFKWRFTVVKCTKHGRCIAVLNRGPLPTIPEHGAPWGGVLQVATVAGLGDTAWVVTKLPGIVAKLGAKAVDIYTCESDRANAYLAKLPFVRHVATVGERIIEAAPRVLPWGAYNYAPPQPNWHDRFHLFLQANGHLETGARLETWLPNVPTDFAAPVAFTDTVDDARFAEAFAARGQFVTFFAGPQDGNTLAGHNVGGAWTPGDWAHVAGCLTAQGIRVVLVGAGPGDQDYAFKSLHPAGFFDRGAEDCINLWELPRTLAVLRRAAGHVGYQSGLGVLSVYFGQPVVMFWNRYGVPLNEHGVSFREEMSGAWVPTAEPYGSGHPHTPGVAGKNYFGAIYGRTDAPTVAEFVVRRVLENVARHQ